jgi:hypothetical protein
MVNQAKLKSFNTAPKYKYGFEISRTYEQAKRLDQKNGHTKWGEATVLELGQIDEYTTFIDKGHHTKVNPPSGFKKIRVHLVFDVKHDGRHKARLVADGHLTVKKSWHSTSLRLLSITMNVRRQIIINPNPNRCSALW